MKILIALALILGVAYAGKDMKYMPKDMSFAKVKLACLNLDMVCMMKAKENMMKLPHVKDFKKENGKLQFQCNCDASKPKYVTIMDFSKMDWKKKMMMKKKMANKPHGCMKRMEKFDMCFNFEKHMMKAMWMFSKLAKAGCSDAQFYKLKNLMKAYLYQYCFKPFPRAMQCMNAVKKLKMGCYKAAKVKFGALGECTAIAGETEKCIFGKISLYNKTADGKFVMKTGKALKDTLWVYKEMKMSCPKQVKMFLKKVFMMMLKMPNRHQKMCRYYAFKTMYKNKKIPDVCGVHNIFKAKTVAAAVSKKMAKWEKMKGKMGMDKKKMGGMDKKMGGGDMKKKMDDDMM